MTAGSLTIVGAVDLLVKIVLAIMLVFASLEAAARFYRLLWPGADERTLKLGPIQL